MAQYDGYEDVNGKRTVGDRGYSQDSQAMIHPSHVMDHSLGQNHHCKFCSPLIDRMVASKPQPVEELLKPCLQIRDKRVMEQGSRVILQKPLRYQEKVDHPPHYGGADNPYEAIKVIDAWQLNFSLGSAVKYICRAGKKIGESELHDLRKCLWYIQHEIDTREKLHKKTEEG